MKKKLSIVVFSFVLAFTWILTASAADNWSDPVYTDVWTDPVETDIWTEQKETEIWSETTKTEVWEELTFTVKPLIDNGSTLVPIRGALEQLGFSIEWRPKDKLMVMKRGSSIVTLVANSKAASING